MYCVVCFYGPPCGMGGDDGLDAYLLDPLGPALLPEVRVSSLSAAEGARALRPESTFCVVPDHTCTGPCERPRHGIYGLLGDEDHELSQGPSRREHPQRTVEAECICQGGRDARWRGVVARVRRVD